MRGTIRLHVHFSGRVQGVGFRYETARIARRFAVTGFVRNLSDGRVELLVEGETGEAERFLDAVRAAMSGFIRDVEIARGPAGGGHAGFRISR